MDAAPGSGAGIPARAHAICLVVEETSRRAPAVPAATPSTAGWRDFVIVGYGFFVAMLGTTLPTPLYAIYQRQLGFSSPTVTVIFAVYAIVVVATLLLAGKLSDQVGRRPVLAVGLAASALSAVCFLRTDGLALVLVGRVLSGVSAGLFIGTATAALLDLAPGGRRGLATALGIGVNVGGLAAGSMLAGILAQVAPDPLLVPFAVDLALAVVALAGLALVRETVSGRGPVRLRPQRLGVADEVRPVFLPAVLASCAGFAGTGVLTAVSSIFLATRLHLSSAVLSGSIVFITMGTMAAGQLVVRRLAVNTGLRLGSALLVVGLASIGLALGATTLAPLIAGAVLLGAGTGLSLGAGLAAINARAPAGRRGETASTFFACIYVALGIPAIGVGVGEQAAGLRASGVTFSVVVALLAADVLARVVVRPPTVQAGTGPAST